MQPYKYRPRLNVGKLNRRITIQRLVKGQDEAGYPIDPYWEDVCTTWACREPLRGRDFFAAAATQTEITAKYKMRYRTGIAAGMRIVDHRDDDRIYMIDVPPLDDVYGDRTETHLMVNEQ